MYSDPDDVATSNAERSFFRVLSGGGVPDTEINIDEDGQGDLRVRSHHDSFPSHFYEDILGDRFVTTYNMDAIEAAILGWDSSVSDAIARGVFFARVGAKPTATSRVFTMSNATTARIRSHWRADWDLPGLTVEFPDNTELTVDGILDADGATLVASDPAMGWSGLRYHPGSNGDLHNVIISGVAATAPASVVVDGASPRFIQSTVEGAGGTGVGVLVTGTAPRPQFSNNELDRVLVTTDAVVESNQNWQFQNTELAFDDDVSLRVLGVLQAQGSRFVASDPFCGWRGMSFEAGALGIIGPAGTTSSEVSNVGGQGASIYVQSADVAISDTDILGKQETSCDYDLNVAGVWTTGSSADVSLNNVRITAHAGFSGLVVTAGASGTMSGSTVDDGLLSWGYQGTPDVYLYENTFGLRTSAQSYGFIWHGIPSTQVIPYPNNTLPSLDAWSSSVSFAGDATGVGAQNNRIEEVGVAPGYATSQYYSDVIAEYAYWGQPTGPDLSNSVVSFGSTFDYCPFITDPATGLLSSCGSNFPGTKAMSGPSTEATSGAWRLPVDLASIQDALLDRRSNEADSRRRALGAAVRAMSRVSVPEAAGLVQSLASVASRFDADRPMALRALGAIHAGRRDYRAVLAAADALLEYDSEWAVHGHLLTALASAGLDQPNAAFESLERARSLAPDDLDVRVAEHEILLRFPDHAVQAQPRSGARLTAHAEVSKGLSLGQPYPNPAQGTVRISVAGDEALRVTVVDALGREVAALLDGEPGPDGQVLTFDTSRLSPGLYLVRAVGAEVATQTFTVVR